MEERAGYVWITLPGRHEQTGSRPGSNDRKKVSIPPKSDLEEGVSWIDFQSADEESVTRTWVTPNSCIPEKSLLVMKHELMEASPWSGAPSQYSLHYSPRPAAGTGNRKGKWLESQAGSL